MLCANEWHQISFQYICVVPWSLWFLLGSQSIHYWSRDLLQLVLQMWSGQSCLLFYSQGRGERETSVFACVLFSKTMPRHQLGVIMPNAWLSLKCGGYAWLLALLSIPIPSPQPLSYIYHHHAEQRQFYRKTSGGHWDHREGILIPGRS